MICRLTDKAEPQPWQPWWRYSEREQWIHLHPQRNGVGCWLQRSVRPHDL